MELHCHKDTKKSLPPSRCRTRISSRLSAPELSVDAVLSFTYTVMFSEAVSPNTRARNVSNEDCTIISQPVIKWRRQLFLMSAQGKVCVLLRRHWGSAALTWKQSMIKSTEVWQLRGTITKYRFMIFCTSKQTKLDRLGYNIPGKMQSRYGLMVSQSLLYPASLSLGINEKSAGTCPVLVISIVRRLSSMKRTSPKSSYNRTRNFLVQ